MDNLFFCSIKKMLFMSLLLGMSASLHADYQAVFTNVFNTVNKINTLHMRRGALFGLAALGSACLTKWLFVQAHAIYNRALQVGDLAEIYHAEIEVRHGLVVRNEQFRRPTPFGLLLLIGSMSCTGVAAASTVFCGVKTFNHFNNA